MVGRKIFLYALVAMLIATAFAGYVRAADVTNDSDATTTITVSVKYPHVANFWLNHSVGGVIADAGGAGANIEDIVPHGVGESWNFSVLANVSSGYIKTCNITAFHDGGNDANYFDYGVANTTRGGVTNAAFKLSWNETFTAGVARCVFPASTNQELQFVTGGASASGGGALDPGYVHIWFEFRPRESIWNTSTPATPGLGWNDAGSWNFNITVTDDQNTPNLYTEGLGEFGVFKYMSLVATGDPSGAGRPGAVNLLLAPNGDVNYSANCRYNVTVYLDGNLLQAGLGPINIPAANIETYGGDIGWTALPGPLWQAGSPQYYASHAARPNYGYYGNGTTSGDANAHLTTQWRVDIPLGLPEDYYTAGIVYAIHDDV